MSVCVICQEQIASDSIYQHLPCKNNYHLQCIKEWCICKKSPTCPLCNLEIDNLPYNEIEDRLRTRYLELEQKVTILEEQKDILCNEVADLNRTNDLHNDSICGLINDYDLLFTTTVGLLLYTFVTTFHI